MNINKHGRVAFGASLIATALLAGAQPASAAPGDGSAYGTQITTQDTGGEPTTFGPSVPSHTDGPQTAGPQPVQEVFSDQANWVLDARSVSSGANRDDAGGVGAQAVVSEAELTFGTLLNVDVRDATAECNATHEGITAVVNVYAFTPQGSIAQGTPEPNTQQAIPLQGAPPGSSANLVLNEQIRADDKLTVNAFHLTLTIPNADNPNIKRTVDVILGSATCGPAAPPVSLASGTGLWLGLGLIGVAAIPAAVLLARRRRAGAHG